MNFGEQRVRALAILAEKGIAPSTYAPPAFQLLWKMGAKVPPPHFMKFSTLALGFGAWFAISWGAFMWFFVWSGSALGIFHVAGVALATGLCFGVFMAAYYRRGRSKFALPTWESLGTQ